MATAVPSTYDASAILDPAGHGPRFFFQRVPAPKTAKNHFCLLSAFRPHLAPRRGTYLSEARRPGDAPLAQLGLWPA
jgi:hypothetical protein